jgi:hypothetical protein|tara:strand:- start:3515 stop:5332 length:1818 start_codon:yes stop_codon:yes gene_type:complete
MASKFGYVERGADSQVDWSEISKGFSDKLLGAKKRREDKIDAIEDATEVATNLNIPLGANTNWNTIATEFAHGDIIPKVGNFKRMYERGELTSKEYMATIQRVTDGSAKAMNLFQNLQGRYGELMKQADEGKMSKFTQQNLDKINRFTNLNNMRLVTQDDGTVVSNLLVPDGKGGFKNSTNPQDTASIEAIANIYMDSPDIYDWDGNLNKIAEKLGTFQYFFREIADYQKAGSITTIEDITRLGSDANVPEELKQMSTKYLDAEKQYIRSMMSNPQNLRSLLMDYASEDPKTGKEYSVCDPGEDCKGSDKVRVFYNANSQLEADLTDEQKDVIEKKLINQLRTKLDREVDTKSTGRVNVPSRKTPTPRRNEGTANEFVTAISNLWYGDANEISTAKTTLGGYNAGLKTINRTEKGIAISYNTGEQPEFFSFTDPDGKLYSQEEYIRRISNYLVPKSYQSDYNNVLQNNRYDPNRTLSQIIDEKPMRSMPRDRVIKSIEDIGPSEYDVTGVSSEDAKRTLHKVLYKYLGIPKDNIKMIMPMLGGSWKAIIKPKGDKSGEKSIELSKEDGNFLYFIKKMMDNKTAQELEESKIAKTTNDGSKPKLNG